MAYGSKAEIYMRLIKKNFVIAISVIFLVLLALPVQADFNPPLQAPPSGNVSAPIYSEGASQTLSGGLSVTSGGLSSTNTSAVAVQGSSQAYAIQGTLSSDSASGDSALYANAFAADANDYAAVIYGGLGMQMASGDIFYLNRDSGIAWPRVSDGASLYGISVTATGELRVIGHGAGINFMNQTPASLMTISEAGVVNVASGGSLKVNSINVCLQDGTNCPAATSSGWTDDGTVVRLITSTDKVGIGTAIPGKELDVTGQIRSSSHMIATNGYGYFDGESVSGELRVGGIYGDLGLYSPSRNIQFDMGSTSYDFEWTVGNVAKMTLDGATGNLVVAGNATVAGQNVCRQDGINCPTATTPTLQTVTDAGNTTTQPITAATINTGLGAYELYAMNQNVRTTDAPTFTGLSANSGRVTSVAAPTAGTDATNKDYVDAAVSAAGGAGQYQIGGTSTGSGVLSVAPAGWHVCAPGEWNGRYWTGTTGNLGPINGVWIYPRSPGSSAYNCDGYSSNLSSYSGWAAKLDYTKDSGWAIITLTCDTWRPVMICSD